MWHLPISLNDFWCWLFTIYYGGRISISDLEQNYTVWILLKNQKKKHFECYEKALQQLFESTDLDFDVKKKTFWRIRFFLFIVWWILKKIGNSCVKSFFVHFCCASYNIYCRNKSLSNMIFSNIFMAQVFAHFKVSLESSFRFRTFCSPILSFYFVSTFCTK